MPPGMRLVTQRLVLRPPEPGDLDALHAILRDPRATRYWSTPPHAAIERTREWLDTTLATRPHEGEDFIVELDGLAVGKVGLYRFPEIGFIFHPDVWGQGIASEALAPVLERAFAVHGLAQVTADVDPRNAASLALLNRHGFRETHRAARTWLIGEEWCDSVYLALARP
ncbi:RimJ/RimL family protein N-acetyltransferase [Novosphingobium chloroacetimidivorans]|uniref:RimJ/RimL family protein N-acetyltransferase n=2 Tax=Novosphingobium chloroacetimidivorans TaxID=1428314 RepID=A0A7W7KBD9_9SPHN|nr:RimJ/RimL family protein N-acetyltransferase [Novosphingobium chloroacetimidivorans]